MRRVPLVAPFLVFLYCYFGKLIFLDGSYGLYYAAQRMLAESLSLVAFNRDTLVRCITGAPGEVIMAKIENLLPCRYESGTATRANACLWRVLPEILLLGAAVLTITECLNVEFETRVAR